MKINPVKRKESNTFEESWIVLSGAIQQIYRKNASRLSFEELYRNGYNLVIYKHGDKLYAAVHEEIKSQLSRDLSSRILSVSTTNSLDLLNALTLLFQDHTTTLIMLRDILMYLDKTLQKQGKLIIFDLGLSLFRSAILEAKMNLGSVIQALPAHTVFSQTIRGILGQILKERHGRLAADSILATPVKILGQIQSSDGDIVTLYHSLFLPSFLAESRSFYKAEGERMINDMNIDVEARLDEEAIRVERYLESSTLQQIQSLVIAELLEPNIPALVNSRKNGILAMIVQDNYEALTRVYKLLARVTGGLSQMREAVKQILIDLGEEVNCAFGGCVSQLIMQNERPVTADLQEDSKIVVVIDPIQWVEGILAFKTKADTFLSMSLSKDKHFQNDINCALETIFKQVMSSPEYLSLFISKHLQSQQADQSLNETLDKSIGLFRFISDKDFFESYYKQHLAKRLLSDKPLNEENERGMIERLRVYFNISL